MTRFLAVIVTVIALAPSSACAQERAGPAALGALSGGLLLGPVGAVAGAVVGFTAGPSISHAWGLNRPAQPPPAQAAKPGAAKSRATASSAAPSREAAPRGTPPRTVGQSTAAPATTAAMPPVQAFE